MSTIIVMKIPKEGRHGDRATTMTPYFDYQILVRKEDGDTELETISGYDDFWSHVKSKKEVQDEAFAKAEKLAQTFGLEVVYPGGEYKMFRVGMTEKLVMGVNKDEAMERYKRMVDREEIGFYCREVKDGK